MMRYLSGGRLILGVGAGWFPEEAEVMGVNFDRRWRHLRESVEALRLLWSKDNVRYDGLGHAPGPEPVIWAHRMHRVQTCPARFRRRGSFQVDLGRPCHDSPLVPQPG